jgi:hypothetical protein
MQEIAILFSSIAGACTVAAAKKFPKNKAKLVSLGANSQIKSQINSLRIEKEILTKTITRLYQNDVDVGQIQRDRLLSRYQHQLGIILTKIEKLEAASKHPDLGPVGEGLITLMDQKLSQLDKRLYELSSKITIFNSQASETEEQKQKESIKKDIKKERLESKLSEKHIKVLDVNENPKSQIIIPTIQSFIPKPKSVELTTLTEISNKPPKFPFIEQKTIPPKNVVIDETLKPKEETLKKIEIIQSSFKPEVKPETQKQEIVIEQSQPVNPPQIEQTKPKQIVKLPEEEKIEEDEEDLDRIKREIMKALSRLEQAEVE